VAEILRMPEVAANTPEAVLSSWNVALDAPYSAGTAIVTVETEKAVVDVEAESDGVLLRFLVDPGSTVEVGAPIAVLGAVGEGAEAVQALLVDLRPTGSAPEAGADVPGPGGTADAVPAPPVTGSANGAGGPSSARLFSSPLARRVARDLGVDLATVVGTGPGGRIRRGDVETAAANRDQRLGAAPAAATAPAVEPSAPAAPAPGQAAAVVAGVRDEPVSRVRAAIARRLTESKQTAPHFYVRGSARVDRLLALRSEINAGGGPKVSVNDLVVKAVGRAHTLVPALNVTWGGDVVRHHEQVDVAIAVTTGTGLVTPVLRGVDGLGLHAVSATARDLAERARDRRLAQHELEGGTITVSNLGMFGTEEFAAIINPPQASILAVGAAREEAVVVDGAITVGRVLRVTLSVDHRPVDGAAAAQWMQALVGLLENPLQILV
jgi:pyruvate dehydrogenase E2 component (dihydrolipoamide acetyltransferase)